MIVVPEASVAIMRNYDYNFLSLLRPEAGFMKDAYQISKPVHYGPELLAPVFIT